MGLQLQPIDEEEGRASPSISERQYWRTFDSCVHLLAVALAASVATLLLTRLCGQQTSWLPVVAVFREQAPAHCQLQAVNVPPPPVPPVLEHLAIYVAFHWDISHLTALSRVLINIKSYPTQTDLVVITNKPDNLARWRDDGTVVAGLDFEVYGATHLNKSAPFDLAWVHRKLVTEAYKTGNHTAFMYIEDDDLLLWEAVLAWAQDEAPLAELGYMRAFARTETSNPKGELMMLNQRDTVNVSTWNFTVRLERPGCDDGGGLTCTFLRLPDPYSSLWVLSRDRVQHFMRHRFWRQETTPTTIWDVREMAADGLAFVDVPDGWLNTEVVPYNLSAGTVLKSATVAHLSNKYCNGPDMAWCFIGFDNFIHT